MEERHYRLILAILAGIAAVLLVVRIVGLATGVNEGSEVTAGDIGRMVGLALLPVAALGLWSWRSWGFWMLGLATAVALVAALPDGLFAAFWWTFLHLTTILLTVEQYFTRKQEAEEASSQSDHPSDDYTPRPR